MKINMNSPCIWTVCTKNFQPSSPRRPSPYILETDSYIVQEATMRKVAHSIFDMPRRKIHTGLTCNGPPPPQRIPIPSIFIYWIRMRSPRHPRMYQLILPNIFVRYISIDVFRFGNHKPTVYAHRYFHGQCHTSEENQRHQCWDRITIVLYMCPWEAKGSALQWNQPETKGDEHVFTFLFHAFHR